MNIGTRKIRSAGRSSGSIEITLPAQLHALEGVRCQIRVHDGRQPQIVLLPDLKGIRPFLQQLWQNLTVGFEAVGELGEFSEADYQLALFPSAHWLERPPLAYTDALLAQREAPEAPAFARLLTSLLVVAGYRLGLKSSRAAAFGDAVAYIMTGESIGLASEFERGLAFQVWRAQGDSKRPVLTTLATLTPWQSTQPCLTALSQQFMQWQEKPEKYEKQSEAWFRTLALEINSS